MTAPTSPPMLDILVARELACALVAPTVDSETLPLVESQNRVAAQTVHAAHALPAQARSAMDGFVLRVADAAAGALPIAGTVAAGAVAPALPPGVALRIFTGAVVPEGADAVVPVEDCTDEGAVLRLVQMPKAGAHIRAVGSEQPLGGVLLRAGTRIAAQHIGLLAANGISTVAVRRRPRVGVFSTGDELGEGADAIPDVNRPMLLALARAAGAEVSDLGIVPDQAGLLVERLSTWRDQFDLLISSGAVSMGGRDFLRPALLQAGGRIEGWRVALKPGKPVMFGTLGQMAVTALPGNPFSAFVGFQLFVAVQLAALTGQPTPPFFPTPARAGFDWARKPGRAEVFPIRLTHGLLDGLPLVQRLGEGVSATLFPLADADGLGFVPAETTRIGYGAALHMLLFAPGGL